MFSTLPQNVNLECDASDDNGENAFYDWLDSNAWLAVTDNCGSVVLDKILLNEAQGCGNTWRKTYEFRAKDECGNFSKTHVKIKMSQPKIRDDSFFLKGLKCSICD